MKLTQLCLSILFISLLFSTKSKAQENIYYGGTFGVLETSGELAKYSSYGVKGGLEIGADLTERSKATFSIRGMGIFTDSDDFENWTVATFLRKYRYDITKNKTKKAIPYVFGAMGAALIDIPKHVDRESYLHRWNFGIQAGVGVDIKGINFILD